MSQNWTALISLIVVLHITPIKTQMTILSYESTATCFRKEKWRISEMYLSDTWKKTEISFIISTNLKTNFSIAKALSWNQWFYILSLFLFTNFNHYWIKCIWVVFTDNSSSFYFLSFIYTQISKRFSKSQIIKITNCQNYKLTK